MIALYGKINLIKADKDGNLEWLKNFDRIVIPSSSVVVKQTEKKEFILSGYLINEKTLGLMKLSTDGEQVIWENSFDTSMSYYNDFFSNSLLAADEDIILLYPYSSGTYLISLTDGGVKKWEKTYEGVLPFIDNTKDMNLVLGGVYDHTTCVMKINIAGSPIWKRIYLSPNDLEIVTQVLSSTDGGVMLYGAGKYDLWLLKTNSYGDVEWNKTFGSKYDEDPISILESKEGGYFCVGQTDDELGSIFFGKIADNGELSWDLTIDFSNGTGEQAITLIKQTTDEGYIIGGTSTLPIWRYNDRWIERPSSWILKLNKHGFIQWKKYFGTSFPPIQTHDDGFIFINEVDSDDTRIKITTISKLNNLGDLQWERSLEYLLRPYTYTLQDFYLISTLSAYFLFLRYLDYKKPHPFLSSMMEYTEMVKLNLRGEMEWRVNLGTGDSGRFIREISDGYLVWSPRIINKFNFQGTKEWERDIISCFPSFNNSDSHLFCFEDYVFAKISKDGIQEWNTHTLLTPIDEDESRWTELSNGNIVILREKYESTTRDLHIITKTETIPCTPNFINNSSTTSVRTIVATPDGGCVVAGEKIITNDHPSRDVYLLKLNSNGLVEWIQTYAVIENQIEGFLIKASTSIRL